MDDNYSSSFSTDSFFSEHFGQSARESDKIEEGQSEHHVPRSSETTINQTGKRQSKITRNIIDLQVTKKKANFKKPNLKKTLYLRSPTLKGLNEMKFSIPKDPSKQIRRTTFH